MTAKLDGVSPYTVASRMMHGREDPEILAKGHELLDSVVHALETRKPRNYQTIVDSINRFRERIKTTATLDELRDSQRELPNTNIAVDIPVDNRFKKDNKSGFAKDRLHFGSPGKQ